MAARPRPLIAPAGRRGPHGEYGPHRPAASQQGPSKRVRAVFSAESTVRPWRYFTSIQERAYMQSKLASGGVHSAGSLSPLAWLTLSVTAHSCEESRSLGVLHVPDWGIQCGN
ncbi:hypothetical protein GCM10009527_087480 [Actinomadura nitritigenes]